MKTISFRNLEIGRPSQAPLLLLDTEHDGICLKPGLNLLVAPNGYGKTTFLQTLAGVVKPKRGAALWQTGQLNAEQDLVYVSEYLTFPKFIYPSEWIEFASGRTWKGSLEEELSPWIDEFGIRPLLGKFLGRMSQGERRKVTWLGAHAANRAIALLDEPLDGLDLFGIRAARNLLGLWRKQERVVCVVAHQVGELLDLADAIYLIRGGKLVPWQSAFNQPAASLGSDEFRKRIVEFYCTGV
jgi:ABC-type multidrug transport system ATPase subunit